MRAAHLTPRRPDTAMLDRLLETRRTHRKAPLPSPPIQLDAAYRLQDAISRGLDPDRPPGLTKIVRTV